MKATKSQLQRKSILVKESVPPGADISCERLVAFFKKSGYHVQIECSDDLALEISKPIKVMVDLNAGRVGTLKIPLEPERSITMVATVFVLGGWAAYLVEAEALSIILDNRARWTPDYVYIPVSALKMYGTKIVLSESLSAWSDEDIPF